jgi:hypothetical protein
MYDIYRQQVTTFSTLAGVGIALKTCNSLSLFAAFL